MTLLFEAIDPRGRYVFCTTEQWTNHVLAKRPWMKNWLDFVIKAIKTPTMICSDANLSTREIYYLIPSPQSGAYLKVVVQMIEDKGQVVTAFPVDSGKSGEVILWP